MKPNSKFEIRDPKWEPLLTPNPLEFFVLTLFILNLILFSLCPPLFSQRDPATEWHFLYPKLRDGLISKEEAQKKLRELEVSLKVTYLKTWDKVSDDRLCFPVRGYTFHAIGGKGGSGYQDRGYDFFDGNRHQGHPGHDIFIHDKGQDGLDDVTGRPID